MKKLNSRSARWLFGLAGLIVLLGIFSFALLIMDTGVSKYPDIISDSFQEKQHRLQVPGSMEVHLTRAGAYGIYYEYDLVNHQVDMPSDLACSLISKTTGNRIEATHDYVETNRYESHGQHRIGVLVMSVTVNQPDYYSFACTIQGNSTTREITVALGPNYVWEFLKIVADIGLPLLMGSIVCCGSLLLALSLAIFAFFKGRRSS